jgi:cardiolipin synthase (CMP-forming)
VRHIPNIISVIRILLVVPVAFALAYGRLQTAIGLFALAAVSDAADGFLARRFGWQSELGGILDPIADKLLLATVFVTLSFLKLVPLWLMIAAVARDVIIVSGAAAYRFFIGPVAAHPSVVSKCNTLCQAAYILAVVGRAKFAVPHDWVVTWLGGVVFAIVVVSGLDYVMVYGRRAVKASAAARSGASRGVGAPR